MKAAVIQSEAHESRGFSGVVVCQGSRKRAMRVELSQRQWEGVKSQAEEQRDWTPSNLDLQSGEWGSFRTFLCFRLGICSCQAFNEYSLFLFPSRDTGRQTARTWYSCAHLMLARTFASALIPCGIAAFCGSMMQLHPVLNDAKFF